MGKTHDYLRYIPSSTFGVIASPESCILYLRLHGSNDRYFASTTCENVSVWDSKTKQVVMVLHGEKYRATALAKSPDGRLLAVGYADGTIRLFNLSSGEVSITFQGHRAAISCLEFDNTGGRLVSGGKDSYIILWDVVSESGLFRLKGHKGVISRCHFMKTRNILVSVSKDTMMKFWDLDTQHCFKTVLGHRSEIWDFVILKNDSLIISGSSDSELRVWEITFLDKLAENDDSAPISEELEKKVKIDDETEAADSDEEAESNSILKCTKFGSVMRQGKGRTEFIAVDSSERVLVCHGTDALLEVFRFNSENEIKKKITKRHKKLRKKLSESEVLEEPEEIPQKPTLSDMIVRLSPTKVQGKMYSLDIHCVRENLIKVAIALKGNLVELYHLNIADKNEQGKLIDSVKYSGHRTDVRTVCFSSDMTAVLSGSGETVKIWNRSSRQCIRSIECEYALCSSFLPGDRHCIIGTKTGKLQLFDIGSGVLLEDVEAHSGPVWSLCLYPDQKGLVTGSGDKDVKFWDFDLSLNADGSAASKTLTVVHTKTLKMDEDVLYVKVSPNGKLLAVSLLDSTIKVFFMDTLKFFLSLYGHKFPALCIDISYDSALLISGSADRNVKIWGLGFGDCHKSIFAHEDSIMCLQFIPKTHMFLTGSKDKMIKQWDADNFQKILTLEGHQAEVWALAVSPDGRHIISSSHDKSLRLWEKTEELVVLEEEQELEREAEFEKNDKLEEEVIPREGSQEMGLAGRKTVETIKATDRLIEAIDVHKEEKHKLGENYKGAAPHPLMLVYKTSCPFRYMLEELKRIKYSELEETLLVMPFAYVIDLLKILGELLQREWEVELCCRCLFFLLKVHSGQIIGTQSLMPVIDQLRNATLQSVTEIKDTIGFNLAGLGYMQREVDAREEVSLFTDATRAFQEKRRRKKRRERVILSVS